MCGEWKSLKPDEISLGQQQQCWWWLILIYQTFRPRLWLGTIQRKNKGGIFSAHAGYSTSSSRFFFFPSFLMKDEKMGVRFEVFTSGHVRLQEFARSDRGLDPFFFLFLLPELLSRQENRG